jgi:DNA polymerase (family 10)
LTASAVARLLTEYAQHLKLRGGNRFPAKSFQRAAANLMVLTVPLDQIVAEDRLKEIPGVGDAIAEIVRELHKTGSHPTLEAMRKELPRGVLEIASLAGIGPERAVKLYKALGISSFRELEVAAHADRIKNTIGLGAALQRRVLQAIEAKKGSRTRR